MRNFFKIVCEKPLMNVDFYPSFVFWNIYSLYRTRERNLNKHQLCQPNSRVSFISGCVATDASCCSFPVNFFLYGNCRKVSRKELGYRDTIGYVTKICYIYSTYIYSVIYHIYSRR